MHRSALLHAINLTSMSLLVAAEIMINRTVLQDGPFTALGQLVYLDALSACEGTRNRGGLDELRARSEDGHDTHGWEISTSESGIAGSRTRKPL
jgi:hypothetical protein